MRGREANLRLMRNRGKQNENNNADFAHGDALKCG